MSFGYQADNLDFWSSVYDLDHFGVGFPNMDIDYPFFMYNGRYDLQGFTFSTKGNLYTYGRNFFNLMFGIDLSANMLSGEIPQELTNLTFLSTLNLSNNQLDGRIPQSHQFGTFQNSSFDGNAGLCGTPLSKLCGTPNAQSEINLKSSSHSVDVVLFLFVGVGFGVGFAAAILAKLDWISKWFHNLRIL